MTERVHLELAIRRSGGPFRHVELDAPFDATVGEVLDRLGAHLGIGSAQGAIHARSALTGADLQREMAFSSAQLLRGEHLRLQVGRSSAATGSHLGRWSTPPAAIDSSGRVQVHRPPRSVGDEESRTCSVPAPPLKATRRKFPVGAILTPLVLGVLLAVVTRRPQIALFAIFSPIMIFWNIIEDRRTRRDEMAQRGADYVVNVERVMADASGFADEWARWMRHTHPDPFTAAGLVEQLSTRIWERRPGDVDYLRLRVGVGTVAAPIRVVPESADTTTEDLARAEAAVTASAVPVVVGLADQGVISVVGPPALGDSVLRWTAAQLAILHSPRDVALAAAVVDAELADMLRWLPHTDHGLVDSTPVAGPGRAARVLLADLAALVDARREQALAGSGTSADGPHVVVLVDARCELDPALVATITELGPSVRVYTIWLGVDARQVPGASGCIVAVDGDSPGIATVTRHASREAVTANLDDLDDASLRQVCTRLAPLADASAPSKTAVVPSQVTLDDLQPDLAQPSVLRRNWEHAPRNTLMGRLGRCAGEDMVLDFGPSGSHVLVGGTTGSGKSELLQTLVTSLAVQYPPDRVAFLLVDYKGGAAFKDAKDFPHTVGLVSDLDAQLTRRALVSLNAEVRRREKILEAHSARDLAELREQGKGEDPGELLIVVDEFDALAREVPEFVDGVVDLAARGRSLGIRLVLATQRPAGVISERIRANVAVRIALRLNDTSDSNDVLGTGEAATIPRNLPGRAFARVHRELVEFQCAYVGGPAAVGPRGRISVQNLDAAEIVGSWSHEAPEVAEVRNDRTLLSAAVQACDQVMSVGNWRKPHAPWLPPLPATVDLAELWRSVTDSEQLVFALADQPERQRQRVVALDLEQQHNMLIFGSSRSGKSAALLSLAASALRRLHAPVMHVYVLDYGGQGLVVLGRAPQCAAVVTAGQIGRAARVIRKLRRTIDERRQQLISSDSPSYADLRRRMGAEAPPRILVLLDSYGGAVAALDRIDGGRLLDALHRLVADGPGVGVHFVITAERRSAVPAALTSIITARLVLRMAERDDYPLLGVDAQVLAGRNPPPGRGVVSGSVEVQVATLGASDDPEDQWQAISALIDDVATELDGWHVQPVQDMPAHVSFEGLKPPDRMQVGIGVGDDELGEYRIDLASDHFLVAGPPRSGRSTALRTISSGIANSEDRPALLLLAPRRSLLHELSVWDASTANIFDLAAVEAILAVAEARLAAGSWVVVVADDIEDFPDPISQLLESWARRGREEPIRIVAAGDNRAMLRSYSGLASELRRSKCGLLLCADLNVDGDLLGVRLRSEAESIVGAGRGFAVRGGAVELIQVAK
jgi:S-DNA-T family DNA segregation ATPase FtsK/SpoIIIE